MTSIWMFGMDYEGLQGDIGFFLTEDDIKAYAKDKRRPSRDGEDERRWARIPVENLHEVNRDEVERLQAKIKDMGIASLTLDERAFLNRSSTQSPETISRQ